MSAAGTTRAALRVAARSAAALTAPVALANAAWLVATSDVAAARHLPLVEALFGDPGAPHLLAPLAALPWLAPALARPFVLTGAAGALGLLGVAAAATALIYALAVLAAAPLIGLLARLRPDARGWWWTRGYPRLVLAVAAAPALLPLLHQGLRGDGPWIIGAAVAAAIGGLWLALLGWGPAADGATARPATRGMAGALASALLIAVGSLAMRVDGARQPAAAAGHPNILLVSIDSLRADHVHAYGYRRETTPALDALAAEGARFATAVAPTSWTLPSHLTLLTGLPPERHGVVADGQRLTARALFVSEVLWAAGYTTAGFVSAPYLDAAYGFAQGFDHYDDYTLAKRSFTDSHHGETGPVIAGLFAEWLAGWEAGGGQRPFFAFLHLWDAHYDYTPPPPYDRLFDPDYTGDATADDFERNPRLHAGMDARDLAHVVALYDGEIRFVDATLARILDQLRGRGILDRTVVVVTADHGEEFFEHGRKGHKQALYDESILVPLVVRYPPRVPAATVVGEQVRLMDVPATILALAEVAAPATFAGRADGPTAAARDLTPWMTAAPGARPPALAAFADLVGDAPVPLAAVRTAERKLIRERRAGGRDALYDLTTDAGEQSPLRAAPDSAALGAELSEWRQAWSSDRLATALALSDAQRERLRALGYLR
jgi:arylsulfatase A-like enzyme